MITKLTTIEELKQMFIESLLNKTDKVTKISDGSVLNGIAFGCAKIGQKTLKEIALVESHLIPDSAFGNYLDKIADMRGIAPRFSSSGSSTYLRLVGVPGTTYEIAVNKFKGAEGVEFELEEDIVLGEHGFTYAKVRSLDTGKKTNIGPLSINLVNPIPVGHSYVVNEYMATGGRDEESDEMFRKRIKEGANILAQDTLSKLTQVFMKINSNILRVFYQGIRLGKNVIAVASKNGIDFNSNELDDLLDKAKAYFSLTDLKPYAEGYIGIILENIQWYPVDISFRAKIKDSYNPDEIRKEIQIEMSKYLDFRFWTNEKKVEWDDLFLIAKMNKGIEYIADQYFIPNIDKKPEKNKLPRLRGFLLLDLEGNIISDVSGILNPVFYPKEADFNFQQTVLKEI